MSRTPGRGGYGARVADQLDPDALTAAAANLRTVLAAVDAGDLGCSAGFRSHLRGALVALEALAGMSGTGDTPGPDSAP